MSSELQLETNLLFVVLWGRRTADGKVILMVTVPEESIRFVGDGCGDDDFLAGATILLNGSGVRNPATNAKTPDRVLTERLLRSELSNVFECSCLSSIPGDSAQIERLRKAIAAVEQTGAR